MKLFIYDDYQLKLNIPEILLIPQFKKIMDSDKTEDKRKAFDYFKYIHLVLAWDSPYSEYAEEARQNAAKEACTNLSTRDFTNKFLYEAFDEYETIRDSNRILRYARSQWRLLDKIEEYTVVVDLTETILEGPQKGKLVHSLSEARRTVKELPDLITKAKETKELVNEEMQKEENTIRGGGDAPLDKY